MYRQKNSKPYKPYSHQRVKEILKIYYHCSLKPVGGYKDNRRYGYVQKYNLVNDDTNEILADWITLNALRIILTEEGFPLHEPVTPCQSAIEFLKYVQHQNK